MKCNLYDNNNKLVGEYVCQVDPLESARLEKTVYLKPANSSFVAIPNEELQKGNSWFCVDDKWLQKLDPAENIYYSKETGQLKFYDTNDEPDLKLYTTKTPIKDELHQYFNGDDWVIDVAKKKEIEIANKKSEIDYWFNYNATKVGVAFEGMYVTDKGLSVNNPCFQYDDTSQERLQKFKDIKEVTFWRSVSLEKKLDNLNIILTNEQKSKLYDLLIATWAKKFQEKAMAIDALNV